MGAYSSDRRVEFSHWKFRTPEPQGMFTVSWKLCNERVKGFRWGRSGTGYKRSQGVPLIIGLKYLGCALDSYSLTLAVCTRIHKGSSTTVASECDTKIDVRFRVPRPSSVLEASFDMSMVLTECVVEE